MVQLPNWTFQLNVATNPNNIDQFVAFRWSIIGSSDEKEHIYTWPFPIAGGGGSFWKGFKVFIYTQNASGTTTISRRINQLDVGTTVTLLPGEPPSVPAVFTDLSNIEVFKFDELGYRSVDTNRAGSDPWITYVSYIEFPDAFWGY